MKFGQPPLFVGMPKNIHLELKSEHRAFVILDHLHDVRSQCGNALGFCRCTFEELPKLFLAIR